MGKGAIMKPFSWNVVAESRLKSLPCICGGVDEENRIRFRSECLACTCGDLSKRVFVRGNEYSGRVCEYMALLCRYYSRSRSRSVEDAVESHVIIDGLRRRGEFEEAIREGDPGATNIWHCGKDGRQGRSTRTNVSAYQDRDRLAHKFHPKS
jgi:hypothetical protein